MFTENYFDMYNCIKCTGMEKWVDENGRIMMIRTNSGYMEVYEYDKNNNRRIIPKKDIVVKCRTSLLDPTAIIYTFADGHVEVYRNGVYVFSTNNKKSDEDTIVNDTGNKEIENVSSDLNNDMIEYNLKHRQKMNIKDLYDSSLSYIEHAELWVDSNNKIISSSFNDIPGSYFELYEYIDDLRVTIPIKDIIVGEFINTDNYYFYYKFLDGHIEMYNGGKCIISNCTKVDFNKNFIILYENIPCDIKRVRYRFNKSEILKDKRYIKRHKNAYYDIKDYPKPVKPKNIINIKEDISYKERYCRDGNRISARFPDDTKEYYNNFGECSTRKYITGAIDKFDNNGNKIYSKFADGHEEWYDRDGFIKKAIVDKHVLNNLQELNVDYQNIDIDEFEALCDIFFNMK